MTSPEELAWNHAIETENFELAAEIATARELSQQAAPEQYSALGSVAYLSTTYDSPPTENL